MNERRLQSVIMAYKKLRNEFPDVWLTDCAATENLNVAIRAAATARNGAGIKHAHQNRIPNHKLEQFAEAIQVKADQISKAKSFKELIRIISGCRTKGVAELTIYDTAQRIGCFLNLKIMF